MERYHAVDIRDGSNPLSIADQSEVGRVSEIMTNVFDFRCVSRTSEMRSVNLPILRNRCLIDDSFLSRWVYSLSRARRD